MPVSNPGSIGTSIGSATGGAAASPNAPKGTGSATVGMVSGVVSGTDTSWHTIVLWFLGAVALIALADPAPKIATVLVLLLILGTLLNNWSIYKSYVGIK